MGKDWAPEAGEKRRQSLKDAEDAYNAAKAERIARIEQGQKFNPWLGVLAAKQGIQKHFINVNSGGTEAQKERQAQARDAAFEAEKAEAMRKAEALGR